MPLAIESLSVNFEHAPRPKLKRSRAEENPSATPRYSGWGLLEFCRRLLGHSLESSREAVGFESRYIFGYLRVLFTCVFALRPPCVKPLPNGDSYEMCAHVLRKRLESYSTVSSRSPTSAQRPASKLLPQRLIFCFRA